MSDIPFALFEHEILKTLQSWGFDARQLDEGVDTGFPLFAVFRTEASIATTEDGGSYHLAVGARALGAHPTWGKFDLQEMISTSGASPEEALRKAAEQFTGTTVSALLASLTEEHSTGFEEVRLSPDILSHAIDGGIHLITSGPHLSVDQPENFQVLYNTAVENPLVYFIPETMKALVAVDGFLLLKLTLTKTPSGQYHGTALINGEEAPGVVEELAAHVSRTFPDWPPFDFSQAFILQPQRVYEEEYWRIESKDPSSESDGSSYATCAANVRLNAFHYWIHAEMQRYIVIPGIIALGLGIGALLLKWWIVGIIIALIGIALLVLSFPTIFDIKYRKEKFWNTLLTPGIITSVNPLKVLCLAPLSSSKFSPTRGEAFRFLDYPSLPGHRKVLGERIPVASAFFEGGPQGYWADFDPEPVCWGTPSKKVIQASIDKLGPEEFEKLEAHWNSGAVPKDFEGLFKLDSDRPAPPPLPK